MQNQPKPTLYRLIAVCAGLFIALLACTVDLGLKAKPDEEELNRLVEASLTAAVVTTSYDLTQTALFAPTDTPAPTFTSTRPPTKTTIPSKTPTPTPEGVSVSEITFAAKVDENGKPVKPSTQFKKGVTKLYGVFTYSGFQKGMKVVFRWDNKGRQFSSVTRDWNSGANGSHWVSVSWVEGGGLPDGNWMLLIFVDGELVQSGSCVIYQ